VAPSSSIRRFPDSLHVVCGVWPEYLKHLAAPESVEIIEIAAVAEQALYGMAEYCDLIDWNQFGVSLPVPQYLRRSTVEERFARGGK